MARLTNFKSSHTETELAYLAGIVDGEGCFYTGMVKQGRYGSGYQFHALLKVSNTHRGLIDYLENTFGGNREYAYCKQRANPNFKPVYSWQATGLMLDYLCPMILPYLIVKRQQCELMIKIRSTYKNIGSKRLPQEIIDIRLGIVQEMKKLNVRGHSRPLQD
jgi:hypothetical protein